MMARMRIREFVEVDTEEVVALWRAAGLVRPWNDPHRDIERKLAVQRDLFLFLLMADVKARLAAVGCPKLNLQVRSDNTDALGFYAALGYSVDAAVSLGKRLIPDA